MRRAYRQWDAARRELLDGLFPLVHNASPNLWSTLWIGLATAIDRLTLNDEPDLLKYVVGELERAEREFWCEESGHVYPPPSTNSTRKRRGKAPHPILRRHVGNIDNSEWLSEGHARINSKGERKTYWFRVPIKLPTAPEHEEREWLPLQVSKTDEERRVLELLAAGFTQEDTAKAAGVTLYEVRKIRDVRRQRVERLKAEGK
jgi:hypothetical protein